jgi:hypothetical protein
LQHNFWGGALLSPPNFIPNPYSNYFDVRWEIIGEPSKCFEPFQLNIYVKNLYPRAVRIKFAYFASFSFSILSKTSTLDTRLIPFAYLPMFYSFWGTDCYFDGNFMLPPDEEIAFTIFMVNDQFNCSIIYRNQDFLYFLFTVGYPFYSDFVYYFPIEIIQKEYSCIEKKIETQYWWEPEEEGEVILKVKNKCGEKIEPEDEKGLFIEFSGHFQDVELLETNANSWEIFPKKSPKFYYNSFLPDEEMYVKLKVKQPNPIPQSDYYGEYFGLTFYCKKDKDKKMSILEKKLTEIFLCMGGKK